MLTIQKENQLSDQCRGQLSGQLSGKCAIVAGGTRGIGRAVSLHLAQQGAKVIALYARNRVAAESLEEEAKSKSLSILVVKGDLTQEEKVDQVLAFIKEHISRIDIIVHCAASGVHRKASELTVKHLKWTFDINVFAIHRLVIELLPLFPKDGGRIIGITSAGGTRVIPYYAAVGASKGALEALFRHYAYEFAPLGIAVNLVCPGLVLTEAVEAFPDKETRIQRAKESTPTSELTTPDDVAALVVFLCLPNSKQIIGQTIVMDGGKTLLS